MALSLLVRTTQGTRGSSRGIPLNATPRFTPFRTKERSPLSCPSQHPQCHHRERTSQTPVEGRTPLPCTPCSCGVARSTSEMRTRTHVSLLLYVSCSKCRKQFFGGCLFYLVMAITRRGVQGPSSQFNRSENPLSLLLERWLLLEGCLYRLLEAGGTGEPH